VTWFSRQIDEIRSDRALTFYGVALALANVLTCYQWQYRTGVPQMIGGGATPLCWPFWENCRSVLSVSGVNRVLWVYLFLSAIAGLLFVVRRVAAGYWLLVVVNVIRTIVMIQDYRLRANQHYMLNWIVLAFLFLPGKRALLRHLIVSLYFWAGGLKLDPDWLTGAALYNRDRLWLPESLVPASCVYVVVLEMVVVFGLYARRNWIFWGTFAQLIAFHIFSWPIVGFWYPLLMFCLLSILPMTRLMHRSDGWVALSFGAPMRRLALNTAVVGTFGALQMIPRTFPGDSAITGEGRMFALHMFDALVVCEATFSDHFDSGVSRAVLVEETKRLSHRSRCDPLLLFDVAKNRCRQRPHGVIDFDVSLRSRRTSEPEYRQTIDVRNFCAANPTYDTWRHNAWIAN
jgi:hypothetical protein